MCSKSEIIRKVQIKTTVNDHYTLIKMHKIQNTNNSKIGEKLKQQEFSQCYAFGDASLIQQLHSLECIKKNYKLMSTQNLYLDGYSSLVYSCQIWKTPSKILVGEQLSKLWYIEVMKYYLAQRERENGQCMKRHRRIFFERQKLATSISYIFSTLPSLER